VIERRPLLGLLGNRAVWRLVFVVLWLAAADRLVDPALSSLEYRRYERGRVFRFENSDLFGLGPLVEYLHEHPRGERPRTLFFGNSIVWGYGLAADAAVPARLQDLAPDTKVFNVAINGFGMGSSYLISRAVIDSVDRLYVLRKGEAADPILPSLIPVSADDVLTFNLLPVDRVERALERAIGWWHLYRSAYRLQASMFGTSTRQFVYLHKGDLARAVLRPLIAAQNDAKQAPGVEGAQIELSYPAFAGRPLPDEERSVEEKDPLMWRFATLARDHGKRLTLLQFDGYSAPMAVDDIATFNAAFSPSAEILVLRVPRSLTFDGMHLTATGSAALAAVLARHERSRNGAPR
jgi:hypothetical protein